MGKVVLITESICIICLLSPTCTYVKVLFLIFLLYPSYALLRSIQFIHMRSTEYMKRNMSS